MVEQLSPAAVFFDFDRTLCTTKTGNSPLNGRHTVDPELWGIASSHRNVRVVTRNSFVEDIVTFLESQQGGAGGGRSWKGRVHHVGKHVSKATIVNDPAMWRAADGADVAAAEAQAGDADGKCLMFVDDSIAELLDPKMAAVPGLTRVLFSRVLA